VFGAWFLVFPGTVFPFDSRFCGWQGVGLIESEVGRFGVLQPGARGKHFQTMAELVGNLLVAQSGANGGHQRQRGGVIRKRVGSATIEEIYGAVNGILGILNEDLIDLQEEKRTRSKASNTRPPRRSAPAATNSISRKKPEQPHERWRGFSRS